MTGDAAAGPAFERAWAAIAGIGRSPATGGYRRFAYTEEDQLLREWFAAECVTRGLEVVEDRMGNQWGWWGDPDGAPGVVTGSHLDSVPDGGAFDGPLGVVSGLVALDVLRRQGFRPVRPIGLVHFGDEEGARFGLACAGSRAITGAVQPARLLSLTDADGIDAAQAMRAVGRDPDRVGPDPEALRRVGQFVELHVEQGRGLAELDRPVAIGTGIWPHGRWRLDFAGVADHAGTTRMPDRRDAMLGLAQAVLAARREAEARGCLATVGKTRVWPGAVNAIPSATTAWLDARGPDGAVVRETVAAVAAASGGALSEESWTPATDLDPGLVDRLGAVLPGAPRLATGAGHDAGILAQAGIPSVMIFVRNPSGVSHSPAEHAEPGDCLAGVAGLAAVLAYLAGEPR